MSSHTKDGKPERAGKQHSLAPNPSSSMLLLCMQNHGVYPMLLQISCFTVLPAAFHPDPVLPFLSTISFLILPYLSPPAQPNYCSKLPAFAISTSWPLSLPWLPPHFSIGSFLSGLPTFSSDDYILLSPYSAGFWICQSTSCSFGLNEFLKGNFVLKYIIRKCNWPYRCGSVVGC